ncbi:N-acetyltransferase family protein [Plantibacter sp. VKM Ac-2880]|uniref:GNAT family N-acetyltransferase n=1 Tax=Plantibacter sp. VKM Ac-2880 TaxID=2783827 RepID=UPI00351C1849
MTGAVTVRPLEAADWSAVETIYREGIATGNATFEAEPPSWEQFDAGKLTIGRLVAVDESGTVLGWVAASPISGRQAYRGVVEHSVYVAAGAAGRGVGTQLLSAFIAAADHAGIWTIQSTVFPENLPSLVLHERAGFRIVGRRERIAHMSHGPSAGRWRDTILLERRAASPVSDDA